MEPGRTAAVSVRMTVIFLASLLGAAAATEPDPAEPWGSRPVASDRSLSEPLTIWCDFGSMARGAELLARIKWRWTRVSACFRRAASRGHPAPVPLVLTAYVTAEGLPSVRPGLSTQVDARFEACVSKVIAAERFPARPYPWGARVRLSGEPR